jgi:Flp pilus assembly protein TadD
MTVEMLRRPALLSVFCAAALAAHAGDNRAEADLAHNAGRTYLADGRADLALEQFKKAVDLDDKNYFAYKGLGLAYASLKNFKEAEKAQRKCLELNSDFADVRNDLAATLMFLSRREEARKEWLTAYASPFNPTPDQTAWNLGNSYLDESNYVEASRWFQTAIQRNGQSGAAQVSLGTTLVAQGRADEALMHLEKAVKVLPNDVGVLFALGEAYYGAGRFAESRSKLEAVCKKDPPGDLCRQATEKLKHFPK